MENTSEVIIVGAGLAGLVLAKVLTDRGVPAIVVEGDESRATRQQGGLLDIHDDVGQLGLRAAGVHQAFLDLVIRGGDAYRILDRNGSVVHQEAGSRPDADAVDRGSRPEVQRSRLRSLLLDSLPAGTVRWGARVAECVPMGGGRHEVVLHDGSRIPTDLLVGADGAWSKVRPLVTHARPEYLGNVWMECNLEDADHRHPGPARVVGSGSLFALGQNRAFLGHREPDGHLNIYAAFPAAEGSWRDIDFSAEQASKNAVLGEFEGWSDDLRALISEADAPMIARPVYRLPVGHRWAHVRGVTLIGDAAHLMPAVGEGANHALLDGGLLGEAIADHPGDLDAAVLDFERSMFDRARQAAEESDRRMTALCADNALEAMVAIFAGLDHPDDPRDAR